MICRQKQFLAFNWKSRTSESNAKLHNNASSHQFLINSYQFFYQKSSFLINNLQYSLDFAGCDYFLFPKLHLAMKKNRYTDIDVKRRRAFLTKYRLMTHINYLKHLLIVQIVVSMFKEIILDKINDLTRNVACFTKVLEFFIQRM